MGDWRVGDSSRWGEDDQTGYVTTVFASGTAHTKGAWAALVASLPFDIDGFYVNLRYESGFNHLFDMGIGGAGSEVVLVSNIALGPSAGIGPGGFFMCEPLWIPLRLPKGTRVAARSQSSGANAQILMKLLLVGATFGKPGGYHRAITMGDVPASSVGTSATTGAVNTKGSWAQLTASLPESVKHVLFSAVAPTGTLAEFALDLGIGGAGSEVVVVPNMYYNTTIGRGYNGIWSIPLAIRAGARVAYRGKASTATLPLTANLVGFV